MATFTNTWDEDIPEDSLLSGLSEAGKVDELIRQMKLDIRERILKFMPVGMVTVFSGDIIPHGFKECNGESLLRSLYPDLFSVIGTVHGASDSSHFNIPEMRGRFTRGWNHGKSTGLYDPDSATRTASTKTGSTMSSGDHVGTEQEDENKPHDHTYIRTSSGAHPLLSGSGYGTEFSGSTPSVGDENRPENIYMKYIIRVDDEFSDGSYSYIRTWDETIPTPEKYMGRIALEIRKLRVDVQELLNIFFPPGLVCYWPSETPPDGYLECNGQEISRTTYPDLFENIDEIYGPGDGETTFNIPDCRGLFIRSHDNGAGVDSLADSRTGGDNIASTQISGIKAHVHSWIQRIVVSIPSVHPSSGDIGPTPAKLGGVSTTSNAPTRTVDSHPKNIYLMAIIKATACI